MTRHVAQLILRERCVVILNPLPHHPQRKSPQQPLVQADECASQPVWNREERENFLLYLESCPSRSASRGSTDKWLILDVMLLYVPDRTSLTNDKRTKLYQKKKLNGYETYRREDASELLSAKDKHEVIRWKGQYCRWSNPQGSQ